jgi:lipid-A-disaccharide synthase-like uncharacterized protein
MVPLIGSVVDWSALGKAAAAALVSSIALALAFSLAVFGTTRWLECRRDGRAAVSSLFAVAGLLGAAVCLAAVIGGVIVMASK